MRHQSPGAVTFTDGDIEFRRDQENWTIRLDTVCLIGEFTDASGPWGDDYCLTFVQRDTGAWYVVPFDASGCGAVIDAIARDLGTTLHTGLANSTVFRSRILWPERMRDRPFLSDVASDGILGRMGLRRTTKLLPEIVEWSMRVAD